MTNIEALAAIEFISIARGIEATDLMMKRANIHVVYSRVICPGKYITVLTGSVSEVKEALTVGLQVADGSVVDSVLLTNPTVEIFSALSQTSRVGKIEALGVLETFSMCSSIEAADTAAKQAKITLIDLRISIMLSGKSYITITGSLSGVESAMQTAVEKVREKGALVAAVTIPNPSAELDSFLLC
jgi:microcompartment protein CcmL/EutN